MPRARRRDAPGLFHHVVVRGVERRTIFVDDEDRRDLLQRLDRILPECSMPCLAWALIPNHLHLLLRTTTVSISRAMARVGTGYVRRFNRRHGRVGHLFQNRFLSRPIEDDTDLRGVLRYIHLNPIKHGLVGSIDQLAGYRWCSHPAVIGIAEPWAFHDVAASLAGFDADPARAREALLDDMRQGVDALGERAARATSQAPPVPPQAGVDQLTPLIDAVARSLSLTRREVVGGARTKQIVRARARVAYRAHLEHQIPVSHLMTALGVSEASVRRAIEAERRRLAHDRVSPGASASVSPNE